MDSTFDVRSRIPRPRTIEGQACRSPAVCKPKVLVILTGYITFIFTPFGLLLLFIFIFDVPIGRVNDNTRAQEAPFPKSYYIVLAYSVNEKVLNCLGLRVPCQKLAKIKCDSVCGNFRKGNFFNGFCDQIKIHLTCTAS